MPDTAIVELIRQNFLTVLGTVTISNGYSGTLIVHSVSRYGNTTGDLDTIVEQGDEEIVGEQDEDGAVGQDTYIQEFLIFVHLQEAEGSATNYDARCNAAIADVRKAVMADVTRGGKALRTEKHKAFMFTDRSGAVAGVMVPFKVHFRTRLDDPFNQ